MIFETTAKTMIRVLVLFILMSISVLAQPDSINEELEILLIRGQRAAIKLNADLTTKIENEIAQQDQIEFDIPLPILKSVPKNPRNPGLAASLERKAKAELKTDMAAYEEKKNLFEKKKEAKVAELNEKLKLLDEKKLNWVFPSINLFQIKENEIGILGIHSITAGDHRVEYWPFEFWGKYHNEDSSSLFWNQKNVMVIKKLSNKKFILNRSSRIEKPVLHMSPTDPERYMQFRVLEENELKQIKEYVESKLQKSIEFPWVN